LDHDYHSDLLEGVTDQKLIRKIGMAYSKDQFRRLATALALKSQDKKVLEKILQVDGMHTEDARSNRIV
jgi:hypothetical protein